MNDFLVKSVLKIPSRTYFMLGGQLMNGRVEPGMTACSEGVELKLLSISILDPLPTDSRVMLLCVNASDDPSRLIGKTLIFAASQLVA